MKYIFVQSCFPVLRQVRKRRKYEVVVYSFLSAILLLSYGVHWDLSCRRFRPETIFFLLAYHIQCCRFPYKKVPLSCASATVHNTLYICQVLPSKRYRENLFQNLEAILPCFRYKIQCYGYFSCLFTCTSGILYLLYGLKYTEIHFKFPVCSFKSFFAIVS